jgi:cytochrome c
MRHLFLAAAVSGAVWAGAGTARAQDAAAGQVVFRTQCSGCHSLVAGRNTVGPSLYGVVGRKAGAIPGFRYSPANRDSGIIWDDATLDRYISNPQAVVPKTIMLSPVLKDAQKRADLIAYLATLHP